VERIKKPNKYRNIKTTIFLDGVEYKCDSKKEGKRLIELHQLAKQGKITELTVQPEFILQNSYKYNGKTIRSIKYISDFKYVQDGKVIIEDVKSPITLKNPVYLLKKKLFLKKYGEQITFIET